MKAKTERHSQRGSKKEVLALLAVAGLPDLLARLADFPPEKLLNPLFSGIYSAKQQTRWNAVSAMGVTVARLAEQDMEAARIVMRRFMWNLNDESGGIGWGTPETMAECLVRHEDLAREYTHILVAFMREDGFYLELPALQQGLMWGIGRLAGVRPELLRQWQAAKYLFPYLTSEDRIVQTLAARALGRLEASEALPALAVLAGEDFTFSLYEDGRLRTAAAAELIREAMNRLTAIPPLPPEPFRQTPPDRR